MDDLNRKRLLMEFNKLRDYYKQYGDPYSPEEWKSFIKQITDLADEFIKENQIVRELKENHG